MLDSMSYQRDCGITAVGVLELMDTFNNPRVRRIELGGNQIGDVGAQIIADVIGDGGALTGVR